MYEVEMPNLLSLRQTNLVVIVCLLLAGCTAKHAKFKSTVLESTSREIAFGATERVLSKYFPTMETRNPEQGVLTTEKSKVLEGDLAEDQYRIFATATVEQDGDHTQLMMKVQRTKRIGAWSWWGLGTTFYEKEIPAGSDEVLFERIRQELRDAVKKAKASPASSAK